MIKNYGLNINEIPNPTAYKLGAVELPKIVLRPDGQWDAYLPADELQFTPSYDTFGCTIYAIENIQQILEKFHFGTTSEYSERYNYNLIKIVPPGADPYLAAESFRNDGVISGQLPMTDTLSEYATPRPMSQKYIELGIAHPHMLKHQWLWENSRTKEVRTALIKEHLPYSPLTVSVTAWQLGPDGSYLDAGRNNTHLTVLYGWNDRGWLIYDSYAPHRKTLSYDHNIEASQRFQLVPSTRKLQLSLLSQLVALLGKWLGLIQTPKVVPTPVVEAPQPAVEPQRRSLEILCAGIQEYEGYYPGSRSFRNKNPGNCKFSAVGYMPVYGNVTKDTGGFAIFPTYDLGWLYLKNLVKSKAERNPYWTLLEFTSNYAPITDGNNPRLYAEFLARKLDVDKDLFLLADLVL